jgi:uncharacterized protein (TIGR03435 family)
MLSVVLWAFGILGPQVIGAPDWLATERYDILAVTGDDAALTDENRRAYLQAFLAERCQFRFHQERREIRVYSLVPSKTGAKLVEHTGPGEYAMRVQPAEDGRLRLRSTKGNLPRLAEILTGQVDVLVVDHRLAGQYDFALEGARSERSPHGAFDLHRSRRAARPSGSNPRRPRSTVVIDPHRAADRGLVPSL